MTQPPVSCQAPDAISSTGGSKGDQVANTADIAAQAGGTRRDLIIRAIMGHVVDDDPSTPEELADRILAAIEPQAVADNFVDRVWGELAKRCSHTPGRDAVKYALAAAGVSITASDERAVEAKWAADREMVACAAADPSLSDAAVRALCLAKTGEITDDVKAWAYAALAAAPKAQPVQGWQTPEGYALVPIQRVEAWIAYLKQWGIDARDMETWLATAPLPAGPSSKEGDAS